MFRISYVHHQENYTVHAALYGMLWMHIRKHSSRLKDVLDTCINAWKTCHIKLHVQYSPPEDECKIFETSRRQEELDQNINLKSAFCWLTLPNSNSFRCVRTVTKIDCDCLSVRPPVHLSVRLPRTQFPLKFTIWRYIKRCRQNASFTKIGQKYKALHMSNYALLW